MDILSESEIQEINTNSKLVKNTVSSLIVSAYELLNKKIAQTEAEVAQKNKIKQKKKKLLKQLTPPLNKVLVPRSCWEICFKSTYKRHLY
jgi:hypothetical protein